MTGDPVWAWLPSRAEMTRRLRELNSTSRTLQAGLYPELVKHLGRVMPLSDTQVHEQPVAAYQVAKVLYRALNQAAETCPGGYRVLRDNRLPERVIGRLVVNPDGRRAVLAHYESLRGRRRRP